MPRKKQKPTPTRKQRRIKARRRRRALDRKATDRFVAWCESAVSLLLRGDVDRIRATKEWYKKMIDREGNLEVGAGLPAND